MSETKDVLANNLQAALKELLKYWYVLLVFIGIAMTIGFFYIQYASPTYRVGASILLRLEGGNNVARGTNDIMRAFDFALQDKTFQNEVFYIQSMPLIREVVDEMELRVSYLSQDKKIPKNSSFGIRNIYKDSPIMVIPQEDQLQPLYLRFFIEVLDDERFYLSAEGEEVPLLNFNNERIEGYANKVNFSGVYKFGSLIENENFSFRVLLNANYSPERFANQNLYFSFNNLNHVAAGFKGALSVDGQGRESTMAELVFSTDNVAIGLSFLNKLIEKYIETNLEESNMLANKTIEHIDQQLLNVSDDLNLSEQQLQNLRRSRNVMNIEEKSRNIYNQLQTFRSQRDEAQRRLSHLQQMNEYFTEFKDSTKILAPSAIGLNDPLLNNLIQELTTLNSEKQRIISQDQMMSPRLQTLNISIENLKGVINENINFSLGTARREIDDLNEKIEELNEEFASLPSTQRELLGIERRFNINDATYTSLLEKRIQAQIIKASKLPDAKIIEPPKYYGVVGPKRLMILFFSFFLGAAIPSGFILGKKLIANRIATKDDLGFITKIPHIASIPHNNQPKQNVVMNYPRSPIAESFHMLRTNLVYYLHGERRKTILVTSSVPGEGKSFSALNLAASFALANSKTVLVEFDLRKPSDMIGAFNTNDLPGVSSYLINKARLEQIIIKTDVPNLDIIQSGQIPPNPIELISSNKTSELMEELSKEYEFIILDTPPYGLLTDSFLLMNYSDLKLFVTRLNYTKKTAFAASMEDIEKKKINNLYILLNDDKEDRVGYGKYAYMKKKKSKGYFSKKVAAF